MELLKNGIAYLRTHPQLVMTVLLVLVIPFTFVVTSQQFINAVRLNQEDLELKRVGMMHDVYASYAKVVNFDQKETQKEIEHLVNLNNDVVVFNFLREENDELIIMASNIESNLGKLEKDTSRYHAASINKNKTLSFPHAEQGVRFWKSYRYIQTDDGAIYYIYTLSSLKHVDELFAYRITVAYYWLAGMLVIVMVLLIRHLKLIDYAYLYQETKKTNEMKDMFTNMIAHELRAPLTAMRGYASMIRQDKDVSQDVRTYAENIEEASERLVLIVSDLLDVARIQSGKLKIESQKTNIQPVVESVLLAMKSVAKEKSIEVRQEGTKTPLVSNIDSKRLHQALTNLVSNAIKYTPADGKITLELSDLTSRIEIRVKDTGMGISAENQKKLFAPFFRVQHTEVDAIVGTGLGMWITKQLIELMKGSIGVESIKGIGTHIVITIPK